jgi:hypothetical protein
MISRSAYSQLALVAVVSCFAIFFAREARADCESDDDCKGGRVCQAGACGAGCKLDKECPGDQTCKAGHCLARAACAHDKDCPGDQICSGGRCSARSAPVSTPPCVHDKDCPGDETCNAGACAAPTHACARDKECPGAETCNGGYCAAATTRKACQEDRECSGGKICRGGRCGTPAVEPASAPISFASYRKGVHFGMTAAPVFFYAAESVSVFGSEHTSSVFGGGGRVDAFLNIGVASPVDLRFGAFFAGGDGGDTFLATGATADVRFNLGSVYSIRVGIQGGALDVGADGAFEGFFGPQASLLSFRFGRRRQLELELTQSVLLGFDGGLAFEQHLGFTYLFLSPGK